MTHTVSESAMQVVIASVSHSVRRQMPLGAFLRLYHNLQLIQANGYRAHGQPRLRAFYIDTLPAMRAHST